MYRSILAAVNEYTNSEIAARYALALAGSCKAKLFLTFVAEERTERNVLKRAEATLERLFLEAKDSGIEVESTIAEGDPVKRISEKVKESGIDIAFISTRREDVKKRFFVKTYAERSSPHGKSYLPG
jgi:nucleotide-binding universal stress UspA family protein